MLTVVEIKKKTTKRKTKALQEHKWAKMAKMWKNGIPRNVEEHTGYYLLFIIYYFMQNSDIIRLEPYSSAAGHSIVYVLQFLLFSRSTSR